MTQRFVIPIKLKGFNDYTRMERYSRYEAAEYKRAVEAQMRLVFRGGRRVKSPVRIAYTWYEQNKRRDKDNVAFAKKFINDALQKAGILPDDGNKWVLGFSDDFVYCGQQKVVVEITEEETDA